MNAIGIVDSGLGGYTVYDRLRTAYPTTAFVFLADQIHAPYGNKSPEDILSITYLNILWFYEQGIQEVILACNTASSVALEFIRPIFPEMTIHGIIDLTVDALDLQAEDKVLILATQATTQSEAYPDAIMMIQPQAKAKGIAMVDLVKHIEMLSDEATIDAYLKKSLPIDVRSYNKIVLGCTHYPIIKDQLTKHVDGTLYDSRDAIVGLLRGRDLPSGESRCFTTGDPRRATLQVKTIFGNDETFTLAVTDPK